MFSLTTTKPLVILAIMTPRGTPTRKPLLTSFELELMTILWRLGEGSVTDVLVKLPTQPPPAYTTVSTMLRILEAKGVVRARKEGRGHVYVPRVAKEEYEERALDHMIHRVFDGAPLALVRRLVESERLSPQDRRAIRTLLDRGKK
jgi:predicted transcriptional regulator